MSPQSIASHAHGILKKLCKQKFTNQISLFYGVINRGFILRFYYRS